MDILQYKYKTSSAYNVDTVISFGVGNTNSLKRIIQEIQANPPVDTSRLRWFGQLENAAAQIMGYNGTSLIPSRVISNILFLIDNVTPNYRRETIRLMKEVEEKVNIREQQQQQQLERRHAKNLKVTSFRLIQATTDYFTYALSWTSHIPGKERGYLWEGMGRNPIKEAIEQRVGVKLQRDRKNLPTEWLVIGLTPDTIPQLKQVFDEFNYDTSAIVSVMNSNIDQGMSRSGKFLIQFDNVTAITDYHLSVSMSQFTGREQDLLPTFMDIVEKAFTIKGPPPQAIKSVQPAVITAQISERIRENIALKREQFIQPAGEYFMKGKSTLLLRGSFSIYQDFQKMLAMKGFDTTELINKALKVGAELRASGHIRVHKIINGVLDGYYKTRKARHRLKDKFGLYKPDEESFQAEVNEYEIKKSGQKPYRLFPLQVQDVQWLYSRQSAILGDETGVGKCLIGSSRVSVNDGYYTLSEIWNNFVTRTQYISDTEEWGYTDKPLYVHSIDSNGKIVKGTINKLFRQQYKGTIITTKTSSGKKISHTPQHRFLTPEGWKNEISINDYVCSSPNMFRITKPNAKISKDLIYILAWQISKGDESNSEAILRITPNDQKILLCLSQKFNKLIDSTEKLYGSPRPYISHDKTNSSYICLNSYRYKKYLESFDYKWGNKPQQKIIPNVIMDLSNKDVALFLRALFDSESHSTHHKYIEFNSVSSKLIYQISILLGRFKINCTYKIIHATNNPEMKHDYYKLCITSDSVEKYIESIGYDYNSKIKNILEQKCSHDSNKMGKVISHLLKQFADKYEIPFRYLGIPETGYISGKISATNIIIQNIIKNLKSIKEYKLLKQSKFIAFISEKYASIDPNDIDCLIKSLEIILNSDLYYEKVVSIQTQYWDDFVYDLCVEKHHNYIAENLICHNTEQLVVAADMRTKEKNLWDKKLASGKVLIFTLAHTVPQFAKRILQVLGMPDKNEFLKSPECPVKLRIEDMTLPNAKWLVLSYGAVNVLTRRQQERAMKSDEDVKDVIEIVDPEMRGNQAQRQATVASLMKQLRLQNFDVMILDECHVVKNSTSNTSQNIEQIGKSIPFKWGASATMSANKALDIHRQLLAIGNSMGFMDRRRFSQKYTGMKTQKFKGTEEYYADPSSAREFINIVKKEHAGFNSLDLPGKLDIVTQLADEMLRPVVNNQIEKLTELHSMLILTDVYHRKTKKQVKPNIPEHTRNPEILPTNLEDRLILTQAVNDRLINMQADGQDIQNPLTKQMAYRIQIALQKVPSTIRKATEIIQQGQKVLIFTCFQEPAIQLERSLKTILHLYGLKVFMSMGEGTGTIAKERAMEEIQDPESQLKALVLGVLSSGTGLDMPNIFENVIVNDFSWTPKDADQIEGRAFRINSQKPVTTHYMVLQDTPDSVIYRTVQKKRDIANRIQEIDEQYAQKVRQNKSTRKELKKAQEQHWALVYEQLMAETIVQHFWEEQQRILTNPRKSQIASRKNWLQKHYSSLI